MACDIKEIHGEFSKKSNPRCKFFLRHKHHLFTQVNLYRVCQIRKYNSIVEILLIHLYERTIHSSGSKHSSGTQCFHLRKEVQTKFGLSGLHWPSVCWKHHILKK